MNLPLLKPSLAAMASVFMAGCATNNTPYEPEGMDTLVPENWSEASGPAPSADWISEFGSDTLVALVEEAQSNNFGVEAAYQRARAAAAAARISNSLRWPSIGAGLRSSDSRNIVSFAPLVPLEQESHTLSLSARWEIDLWNRLGLQYRASEAQYQASQYDFEFLKLSLASQVAKAWFNAIESNTLYELAVASAESFDRNLQTLERRYQRGLVDAFDLRLMRAQVASSRASAVTRRSQMDQTIRNLETLLGRYPSAAQTAGAELPELRDTPAAGLPSELLARRPDVIAEQNRLLAAVSLEKSANRNWLPQLVLTGSEGITSPEFRDLLDTDLNVWSLAGDLSMALFQSGRLKAEREQFNANQLAQLAQYKNLVLQSFREVETALRAESDLRELEAETEISARENRLAENQAWSLYERGLVDIFSVLEAERRSFNARSQLISIRNLRLQNRVNLHVALGGDFETSN